MVAPLLIKPHCPCVHLIARFNFPYLCPFLDHISFFILSFPLPILQCSLQLFFCSFLPSFLCSFIMCVLSSSIGFILSYASTSPGSPPSFLLSHFLSVPLSCLSTFHCCLLLHLMSPLSFPTRVLLPAK